ncbi:LysR family transcriptional regulator [Rhodobacteraceae bacterium 2CG4]|uniref:LysR family transcriptional regulator n=2 Tax=Halovulum marinum TaxID=2662447 RepID=A0A6L5Z3E5_9RHOB|nr:LysR family transcriptional regulator [Halovulum marinum]
MIEINHLRCFVVVAEELHFGRAAVRLNMTQPPLSRRIQSLEHALGCELFNRNSRSVEVTEAGKTFYSDARRILRLLELSLTSVKDVSDGRAGLVRCGFTAASAYQFMPALVRRMDEAFPGVVLKLKEMMSRRQISALEIGEIDVALTRLPIDGNLFDFECVFREEMRLVCHQESRLATKPVIYWSDLNDVDMILYDRDEAPHLHELLSRHFVRHNITPRVRQELAQIHTIISLVRNGIGVAFVPETASVLDQTNVVLRKISDADPMTFELYIAWRKDNRSPIIQYLLDIAREL